METKLLCSLVGIRQATHAAHDAEHVVVRGVHIHVRRRLLGQVLEVGALRRRRRGQLSGVILVDAREERGRRQRQVQHGIVNAREVARPGRLQVLRLERERVHVDARGRRAGVVLVGLHEVEVVALALREPILAVQLDLGHHRRVAEVGIRVPPRRVGLRVAVHVAGVLHHPHELLAGVVERQLDLVGRGRHRLRARELQLLNQVLVGDLGEAAALLRVQVDVVHVQRARRQALVVQRRHGGGRGAGGRARHVNQELHLVELHVNLHLVVLQRNQRQRQARVPVEPELQGDVQRLLRDAVNQSVGRAESVHAGVRAQRAVRAEVRQRGVQAGQGDRILRRQLSLAGVAAFLGLQGRAAIAVHHVEVGQLLARGERELIPHVQPLTVVLVNLLATDLHIHVVNQVLAQERHPRERANRLVHEGGINGGQGHLHVHAGDQVAVTRDGALHALAEVAHAVERLLNGLHREVGVAAVQLLEKGNLGVRRQVHVLGAIGDELH